MQNDPQPIFRRYRAPREEGETLVDPPWDSLTRIAESNRWKRADLPYDLQGQSLEELASSARFAVLAAAVRYTRSYDDCDDPAKGPWIVSGHQPDLFHAGVWFKNFALGRLAKKTGGIGLHLLIDSDLCRHASVRTPTGDVASPRIAGVAYDRSLSQRPFEEREVTDLACFRSFPARVARTLEGLVDRPLVADHWEDALVGAKRTANLGLALSEARHRLESSWGNRTLELPMSQVSDTREFMRFSLHLMRHLPRFQKAYNGALAEYRAAHRLRTGAQPMPDLSQKDKWFESPFWVWNCEDPTRKALFVRHDSEGLTLTDRAGGVWRVDASEDLPLGRAIDQLTSLRRSGVKVRPRALMTTLFLRLALADLFLHGIGGAKYDQVTDRIAERFFGFAPPRHATLSATFRLPIEHPQVDTQRPQQVAQLLRELRFHPERFVDDPSKEIDRWIATKRQWIATPKTPENASERHQGIARANRALQPAVASLRIATEEENRIALKRLRSSEALDSREYAYCLFPEKDLQRRMLEAVVG